MLPFLYCIIILDVTLLHNFAKNLYSWKDFEGKVKPLGGKGASTITPSRQNPAELTNINIIELTLMFSET